MATNKTLISWRYLCTDSEDVGFDVYKNGKKLNSSLITDSTNFIDTKGNTNSTYYISSVLAAYD